MKKRLIIISLLVLLSSSLVFSNTLTLKMSYFMPRAQSGLSWPDSLWTIELDNMNFTRSNFYDSSLGLAYEYFLSKRVSLALSIDVYYKSKGGFYKDYRGYSLYRKDFDGEDFYGDYAVANDHQNIFTPANFFEGEFTPSHRFDITITPIQLSLKIAPLGRRIKFIPYFGAGAGVYIWSVRLQGDMISFDKNTILYYDDQDLNKIPVYPVYFVDALEGGGFGRVCFGYNLFGGFMYPVGHRLTLEAEFKFNHARSKLKEAFKDFGDSFDLSGFQLSLGINYWF